MTFFRAQAWMAVTVISFVCASASPPPRASPVEVGAWLTYWDLERGLGRVGAVAAVGLPEVFLFSAALSSDGGIVLLEDEATVQETIHELAGDGRRVWLTIVNDVHPAETDLRPVLKDGELVHRILSNPTRLAAHRDGMVTLARRLGVSGIDIDYENLDAGDRDRFTDFIASLASALHREEIDLSVTVQPKNRETSSTGPGAADWSALCPFVERLQVMLYNQHSGKTGPGPMATREWIASVLGFAAEECAPSRVVPVVKLSGMEWSPAGVRGIQYQECVELAWQEEATISRDEPDRVPYFSYVAEQGLSTVFFEDATSIEVKLRLIGEMGFQRALLWSLGREDPEILRRFTS